IEQASMLDVTCKRPADFDLAAFWQASTVELRKSVTRFNARVRVDANAADWIRRWRVTWAVVEGPEGDDGWTTFDGHFEHEDEACFVILGLGKRAKVLAPPAFCARVRDERLGIAAMLAETDK